VYQPLINRSAPDHHYVRMGRWCSIVGVLIAIITAYASMLFSNILVYLQVLVLFFIVPLFGVVIMGMLWKQATPAGGFWGLASGTLASIFMFLYVHWFPDFYVPFMEKDVKDLASLATKLHSGATPPAAYVARNLSPETRQLLENFISSGKASLPQARTSWERLQQAVRAPDPEMLRLRTALVKDLNSLLNKPELAGAVEFSSIRSSLAGRSVDPSQAKPDELARLNRRLLVGAFTGELAPMRKLEATQLNPKHAEHIATSPRAQDMAVNMFSAFWSLLLTIGVVIMVSLFTQPKPDSEIRYLVYGLAPLPDEGPCPWYEKPTLWAAVVAVVLVIVNIVFW
ncbi:MAG: hypothetical protein N3G20_10480, partial [Verrucomicrobiae bacterium]|nr:hypothetical protein [Verrucomicrobiae bacterium]